MTDDQRGIKAYDNLERANSYHKKKGFSPERKEEMLRVTVDTLIQIAEKSTTLLELGAGTGHLTNKIMETKHFNQIIVTDGAEEMLAIAKQELKSSMNTKLTYQKLDFSLTDWIDEFARDKIHAITSSMAVHHVQNKKRLFSDIYKILSPRGAFVFADHMAGSTETIDKIIGTKRAKIRLTRQGKDINEENIKRFIESDQKKQDAEGNKCESIIDYISYLEDAGFQDVDCIWKDHWLAVFVARKG